MAYNITLSNGSTIVTIPDGAIYNTYSVPLIGQNTSAYGDDVAVAFLRSLENFAFTSPPDTNPNIPGSVKLTGQLWYDTANAQLKVYNGGSWVQLLTSSAGLEGIAGDITPAADSTYDIGTTALRWAEGWYDNLQFGGTMTAEGTSTITTSGTLTADGGSTVNLNGTNSIAGATFTDTLTLDTATDGSASLNVPEAGVIDGGTMATGDIWLESDGIHAVINGSEVTLATTAGLGGGVISFNTRGGLVTGVVGDYSAFYTVKDGSSGTQTISSGAGWTFNNSPLFNNATPFAVTNTALVTNLNADLLDGQQGSYYAVDTAVVKLTGTQNIDGDKTFTNKVRINSDDNQALRLIGSSTGNANQVYMSFYESNDSTEVYRIGDDSANGQFFFNSTASQATYHQYGSENRIQVGSTGTSLYAVGGILGLDVVDPTILAQLSTRARVYDYSGSPRSVGFNDTPSVTISGAVVLSNTHIGKFLTRTAVTVTTLQLIDASDMAIGASAMVHNDNSTGTLTVIDDGSSIIEWVDGSGSAPLTGTRTIAYNGVATVRRKNTSTWQIWGNGIS